MLGAVRAAELRSSSMASILSNRTDSGCVTRSAPFSASRTASRFWFCQPFSDLLGPLLTFDCSQQTRDFLGVSDLAGSAPETAGIRQSLPNLLGRVPEVRTVGWSPSSRCSWLAWSSVHGCGLRACSGIRCRCEGFSASGPRLRSASPAVGQVRSRSIWTTVMCASRRSTTRTRRERVVVPDRVRAVLADRFGPGVELHLGEVDRFQGLRIPRRRSAGQLAGVDRDGVAVVGDARALTPRRVACGWSPARRCRRRR